MISFGGTVLLDEKYDFFRPKEPSLWTTLGEGLADGAEWGLEGVGDEVDGEVGGDAGDDHDVVLD